MALCNLLVALGVVFLTNVLRMIGGGDAKFLTVTAVFIAVGDWLFAGSLSMCFVLSATVTGLIVIITPIQKLAPDWKCLILGSTMIYYLV